MSNNKRSTNGRSRNNQPSSTILKVVLLGDGGVGKSCIMNRYVSDTFSLETTHTIGVEFLNKTISVNNETYTLQIWDTAGQERFKSLRTPFYRGSDVCILTFSLTDRQSFENVIAWKKEFVYYADIKNEEAFPFIVVGNKIDVDADIREVSTQEALNWCQKNKLLYIETSAKLDTNISAAFVAAVSKWHKMEQSMERPFTGSTVNLARHQDTTTETSCCG